MESKTIKINKENYLWLLRLAGEMQKEYHKPVTFDLVINKLKNGKMEKKKIGILDLAGRWKDMTDKEAKEFMKNAKKGWGKWKTPSL